MPASKSNRVQKHRALRASGLRPVQLWLPDTRVAGFAEECRRQASVVAAFEADVNDCDLDDFLDKALADLADRAGR